MARGPSLNENKCLLRWSLLGDFIIICPPEWVGNVAVNDVLYESGLWVLDGIETLFDREFWIDQVIYDWFFGEDNRLPESTKLSSYSSRNGKNPLKFLVFVRSFILFAILLGVLNLYKKFQFRMFAIIFFPPFESKRGMHWYVTE
jgi:hypothetical protein